MSSGIRQASSIVMMRLQLCAARPWMERRPTDPNALCFVRGSHNGGTNENCIMNRGRIIVILTAAVMVSVVLVLQTHRTMVSKSGPVEEQLETGAKESATGAADQAAISAPSSQTSETSETSVRAESRSEWQIVEQLLAQPRHRPLMREVPQLSPETERKLIVLYHQIRAPSDKCHIIRMLAFGGASAAAATLINAVTNEYAGARLPDQDYAIVAYIPELLGVLARKEAVALEFLLKASRPEFWEQFDQPKWEGVVESPDVCVMVAGCLRGLGKSGRIEAVELIEYYRDHPDATIFRGGDGAVICQFIGSVVDAAFTISIVSERGLETVMDEVFYDPERTMREFTKWRDGPGLEWKKWSSAVREAAWRDRQGVGKPSTE